MAFSTGVSTSQDDFIAKIKTFATTQCSWSALGTGPDGVEYLQNGVGGKFGLTKNYGQADVINVVTMDNYVGGAAITSQDYGIGLKWTDSGFRTNIGQSGIILFPITTYWFFGTSQYIHFVIESVPGEYWHGGIGTLNKTAAWPGLHYAMGTNEPSVGNPFISSRLHPFSVYGGSSGPSNTIMVNGRLIRASIGYTYDDRNNSSGVVRGTSLLCTPYGNLYQSTYPIGNRDVAPYNDFAGRTLLMPILVSADLVCNGMTIKGLLGSAPDMAVCGLKYLGRAGTLTISSDEWYLFPVRKYAPTWGNLVGVASTGPAGLAYKRID